MAMIMHKRRATTVEIRDWLFVCLLMFICYGTLLFIWGAIEAILYGVQA